MTCPRCSVAELSPVTGICELCGYGADASVAVDRADATVELAQRQLAHEFVFGEVLGRGKESTVIRVREKGSDRSAILKAIARTADIPDAEESFRGSLGAFTAFDHPHLAQVIRFGSTDSLFWYASTDVEGATLRSQLVRREPMELRACRRIATQVAGALDYLHRRGAVHGGIKPENILVDKDGWVRLCDPAFLRPHRRRPRPSTGAGARRTEPVLPPRSIWVAPEEHSRGERSPASDQYALAATIFECLAAKPPATTGDDLMLHRQDLPPNVVRAVARALSEDPNRRFPSCTEFLGAMEEGAGWKPEGRNSGRVTEEVVMIKGWEPPPDPLRPLRILARVAVAGLVAAALYLVVPRVQAALRPRIPASTSASAEPAIPPVTIEQSTPAPRTSDPVAAPAARETPPARTSSAPPPSTAAPRPAVTAPRPQPRRAAAIAPVVNPRLFINATPWGQVYVDGEFVGNTPRANLELTPGSHVVRVIRTGFVPFERSLRLAPGDTLRLTDLVLEPARP